MAELQQQDGRNKRGGIRSKKLSTRVDLTPMVDLGFLLITFFIFTTTLAENKGMGLIVPDDRNTETPSQAPEGKTISLVLDGNDVIRYYHGRNVSLPFETDYSARGLRAVLQQKIHQVKQVFGRNAETIVLIKPTEQATYRNIVAVLDEIAINNVKKYVLMEPSPEEKNR